MCVIFMECSEFIKSVNTYMYSSSVYINKLEINFGKPVLENTQYQLIRLKLHVVKQQESYNDVHHTGS